MNTSISYEFPLNERIRIFIRLEQLFKQFNHHLQGGSVLDKRAAIGVLLDIVAIFKRNDLKSEVLKELDRYSNALKSGLNSNQVPALELSPRLTEISQKLYLTTGKIGNHLIENELFQSIVQRSSIPGGTCSFDLPEFHFWLMQDNATSFEDLTLWSRPFMEIFEAITLILNFIRSRHTITEEIAPTGFFQITLNSNKPYQLLRIEIEKTQPYFVEISGGKHRCTIRFMYPARDNQRPKQCAENVPFILTSCII